MKTKIFITLLCLSLSLSYTTYAQQTPYYYYKGKKVNLEIDYSRISVVTEGALTPEKVKNQIIHSDFIIKNRMKRVLKQEPTSNDKLENLNQGKEVVTSEIVFTNKKDSKQYDDFLRDLRKEKDVITTSPTYLCNNQPLGISNNFLVKIRKASDVSILESFARKYAIQVLERDEYLPMWYTLSCTKESPFNAVEAANCFFESKLFESSEPDFIFKIDLHSVNSPNDPYFSDQWGLKNTGQYGGTPGIDINIENAWTKTTGSPSIRVAVFDSGVEMDQLDLDNVDPNLQYDLNYPNLSFHTYGYHGTCVAGIIGAQKDNNIGICGVCPGCTIISIGMDNGNASASLISKGFSWARSHGVDIINCSWGYYLDQEILDDAIDSVFQFGRNGKGCVVVCSVGNNNTNITSYLPKCDPRIITVGAISPCGERKFYFENNSINYYSCDSMVGWGSNYGTELDVVAPGVIISTVDAQHLFHLQNNPFLAYIDDGVTDVNGCNGPNKCLYNGDKSNFGDYLDHAYTRVFYGTSAACPFVSGIAALILSKDSNLTVQQVSDAIERSATKLSNYTYTTTTGRENGEWNGETGYGLVNADSAIQLAGEKNIFTQIFSGDTTIYGTKVVLWDVIIESGTNVIIKADEVSLEGEVLIDGIPSQSEIEVELGSTFEITSNN